MNGHFKFDPGMLAGMGVMDSHKYRGQFLEIAQNAKMSMEEVSYIIMAAVAVKSGDRIIKGLEPFKAEYPILGKVMNFYRNHTRQYVPECTLTNKKFPVVKIPESFPSVAMIHAIFMYAEQLSEEAKEGMEEELEDAINRFISMTRVDADSFPEFKKHFGNIMLHSSTLDTEEWKKSVVKATIEHLFAAQFRWTPLMQEMHKTWEKEIYWGTDEKKGIITKSRFQNRSKDVKLEFQEKFYETKEADSYSLLDFEGASVYVESMLIDEEKFAMYIAYVQLKGTIEKRFVDKVQDIKVKIEGEEATLKDLKTADVLISGLSIFEKFASADKIKKSQKKIVDLNIELGELKMLSQEEADKLTKANADLKKFEAKADALAAEQPEEDNDGAPDAEEDVEEIPEMEEDPDQDTAGKADAGTSAAAAAPAVEKD